MPRQRRIVLRLFTWNGNSRDVDRTIVETVQGQHMSAVLVCKGMVEYGIIMDPKIVAKEANDNSFRTHFF